MERVVSSTLGYHPSHPPVHSPLPFVVNQGMVAVNRPAVMGNHGILRLPVTEACRHRRLNIRAGLQPTHIQIRPRDRRDLAADSHNSDNLGRSRTRSMSLLVPPRLGGMYYPTIQQTVVVDGALNGLAGFTGIGAGVGGAAGNEDTQKTRRRETIFGPDVGDDDQPGWTSPDEGNKVSVDVVKRWVERAKGEEVRLCSWTCIRRGCGCACV